MADLPETLPLEMDTRASEELMEFAHKEVTRERYLGQKLEDNSIAFFVVAMICGAEQDPKSTRQEVTKEVIELFSSSLGDEAAGRLAEAFVLSVWEEGARICRRHGLLKGPEPIRAPPGGRVSSAVVAPATDEEEKRRLARASRFGNVASAAIRGAADDARHRTDGPLETGGRRGRNRGASPGNGFRGASPGGRKVRAEAGGVGGRLIGGAVKAALAGGGGGGGGGSGGGGGGRAPRAGAPRAGGARPRRRRRNARRRAPEPPLAPHAAAPLAVPVGGERGARNRSGKGPTFHAATGAWRRGRRRAGAGARGCADGLCRGRPPAGRARPPPLVQSRKRVVEAIR
ncbi:unnamed protein product [Pedinophyceae sp. YPF-701]|nr:unnamed protein product [Pedinophyceae sp. YPF-701]